MYTWNKQYKHNLSTACENLLQLINLFTGCLQPVSFYAC